MKFKQEVVIRGKVVSFWMVKRGFDDIDVMAEMAGHEPVKVVRLRPDGMLGIYKITNPEYPFDLDSDGYIICR